MRIVYIDIDSQRADHLGCYGYHRPTSPHIDKIAAQGLRFDNVYVSDAPCLPSRTALFSGRFGIKTGIIGHGGTAADLFLDGKERGFNSLLGRTSWMRCFRDAGMRTVSVSPFADRHGAMHFYANFHEIYNTGRRGLETADEIAPVAIDWIRRRGEQDGWFLHINLWDPHTPYRTPANAGEPFADYPLPAWYTDEVRRGHLGGAGPHSAAEPNGFTDDTSGYRPALPRHPLAIDSMAAARQLFDGYDTGVWYADLWIGRIMEALHECGIADTCVIAISADHGENLGELNVYGDHHTADQHTTRVPFILRWPGITDAQAGRLDRGLYYQFDLAATMVGLLGRDVFASWDGVSFADAVAAGRDGGRDALILSQGAWTCQRAVRFRDAGRDYLCIRSYHDGYHLFPEIMLFDLGADPHEQTSLTGERPDLVGRAMTILDTWHGEAMRGSPQGVDPMWTVMAEGGPKHVRGKLPDYLDRLRKTGRSHLADALKERFAVKP